MFSRARTWRVGVSMACALAPAPALAQESASAAVAQELVRLLDEKKLDVIGGQESDELFVAALYVSGSQLLVVGSKSPPERPEYLIAAKQYRDLYAELSAMRDHDEKIFVMDLEANGLQFRRRSDDEPFDIVETRGQSVSFNGEWGRRAPISEEDYRAAYASDDERYTRMLQALVDELKE